MNTLASTRRRAIKQLFYPKSAKPRSNTVQDREREGGIETSVQASSGRFPERPNRIGSLSFSKRAIPSPSVTIIARPEVDEDKEKKKLSRKVPPAFLDRSARAADLHNQM